MKKILTVVFAGAMLMACGSSNKSATGTQNTMPATSGTNENMANPNGDQQGAGTSTAPGTNTPEQQGTQPTTPAPTP